MTEAERLRMAADIVRAMESAICGVELNEWQEKQLTKKQLRAIEIHRADPAYFPELETQ